MNRQKRKRLAEKIENRKKDFLNTKQKLNGNPDLVKAIEDLQAELDIIKEGLNLDI